MKFDVLSYELRWARPEEWAPAMQMIWKTFLKFEAGDYTQEGIRNFYEFITEADMLKNEEDPTYIPKTCLMDEVVEGEKYELVITVLKGGAFARYRCGDMYRCVGLSSREDKTMIPRFEYVDRVPSVIDIAGFTRISENGITSAIKLSQMPVYEWVAVKEYNEQNRPYLHLYVEMERSAFVNHAMSAEILREVLSTYFKYIDQDYRDLKKILGMEPLVVTILRCGTFDTYQGKTGKKIRHMNPAYPELKELLRQPERSDAYGEYYKRGI